MNEIKIDLTELNTRDFFGDQNSNIAKLRTYFPKIKIVARGNSLKVFGEPHILKEFETRISMLIEHFMKFNKLNDEIIERIVMANNDQKNELNNFDLELLKSVDQKKDIIINLMSNFHINSYISEVFKLISNTNKYFSDQKPWDLKTLDNDRMNTVLWVTCEMLRRIGILLQPVIPSGSSKLLDFLLISEEHRLIKFISDDYSLNSGKPIKEPEIIFPKIELKK